jgi:hypothetical protein
MEIYPRIQDIDNKQFFVCSYCSKKIEIKDEYITDENEHIKTSHYKKRIIKPAYSDIANIRKLTKTDKNIINVFQMRNYYPEIFIIVFNYDLFIKNYRHKLKSNTSCHVYQKRTTVHDFKWNTLDKKFINPMFLYYVSEIKISSLCIEPDCKHYGTLIKFGQLWFEIPVMTGKELFVFYNIMSDKDKKHFTRLIV